MFDGGCHWETEAAARAFDVFTYKQGRKATDPPRASSGRVYTLAIQEWDEAIDRTAAVTLLLKVLANRSALVAPLLQGIWDDINGRGPDSGMWWHGDLSFPVGDTTGLKRSVVAQCVEDDGFSLACPEDFLKVMGFKRIVARHVHGHDGLLAELDFDSAFEMEHGIGILTDGEHILGTGYEFDVDLFER